MNTSKIILGVSLLLACVMTSQSQQRPPEIVPQLGEPTGAGVVTYIEKLTPEQHKFYWKGTVKRDEYFLVDVPTDYISVVSMDIALINSRHNKPSSLVTQHLTKTHLGLKFLGRFNESPNRVNDFYEGLDSRKMMLITWRFAADGGGMRMPADFINNKVNKNKATLSLGKAPNLNKVMWVLGWNNGSISYELFMEDELGADGEPLKKPKSIIALAENLTAN